MPPLQPGTAWAPPPAPLPPGTAWAPPPVPPTPPPPPGWAPPPPSEGSWPPRPYRRGRTRATIAQLGVGLTTCVLVATVAFLLDGIGFATRAWGGAATQAELDSFMSTATTLDGLTLLCQVCAGIAVLAWVHRSVANTPALGGGIPRWTPAKSAAWWLVPAASLVLPWTIMRDLWRRTSPEGAATRTWLIAAWWLCYVGGNAATSFASSLTGVATSAGAVRSLLALTAATVGCTAISGVALIWIVRRLEGWADARAAAMITRAREASPLPVPG
jgi:hypothetical protein